MVAPTSLGTDLVKVPESAASRLNGKEDEVPEVNGGSMREKGADVRRLLLIPSVLRLGERPAGAVNGARGDDMLALIGVLRREGMLGGGGIDLDGAKPNVNGLNGFSLSSFLDFLEGELNEAGSTFSLSASSNMAGSNGLLVGENTLFEIEMSALPLDAAFCGLMPMPMSNLAL